MAFIGMRYPMVAQVKTEPANAALTYETGMVLGHAIEANVTFDRSDNPLYGDDVIIENDNGMTGGEVEINVDDLTDEVRAYVLGLVKKAGGTGGTDVYELTDAAAPYVGVGYIRVRRKAGVTSFQGVWYHKVQFSEASEAAATKGENIEWSTPTITGKIMGVYNDATGVAKFRQQADFTTEAAAVAWLKGLANVSDT